MRSETCQTYTHQQLAVVTQMILSIKKQLLIDKNKRQVSPLDIPVRDQKLFDILYVCLLPVSSVFAWTYLWGTVSDPVLNLLLAGGTVHIVSKVIPVWLIKVKNLLKPLGHNSKHRVYDYLAKQDSIRERVVANEIEELSNDVN